MNLKIITKQEWGDISDALFYVRKSYNTPNQDDEARLKNIELYLQTALGLCGQIRKRWGD